MKPGYEPHTPLAILGWVIEECGEVLQTIGKILRFGPNNYNPDVPPEHRETNAQAMRREMGDLAKATAWAEEKLFTEQPLGEQPKLSVEAWERAKQRLVEELSGAEDNLDTHKRFRCSHKDTFGESVLIGVTGGESQCGFCGMFVD